MIALIISLLLSLGIISSPQDYQDASPEQQEIYNDLIKDDLEAL